MSEEKTANLTGTTTSNYTPNTTSMTTGNLTVGGTWTYPSYASYPTYTTGYMYAQLTEQQLSDLESRMSQVVRKEITHTLSLLLSALSDNEEDEEVE